MPAQSETLDVSDTKRSTGVTAAKPGKAPDPQHEPAVVRTPPSSGSSATPPKEEPEPRFEPAIPLDGKDEEGERLMEQLGRERREKEGTP